MENPVTGEVEGFAIQKTLAVKVDPPATIGRLDIVTILSE